MNRTATHGRPPERTVRFVTTPTLLALPLLALPLLGAAVPATPNGDRRTPVVRAVERVADTVVGVRCQVLLSERSRSPFGPFFRDFYGSTGGERLETLSQGSGVIIDAAGYVVTNYHVIAAGGDIEIELGDRQTLPATVVGSAPDHDLAVLQVRSPEPLPFVPMGSSEDLMIGETVIAIGNPFGLSRTVTTGVVSALHRSINANERSYADFIQTDAAINPGNSGGALLTIEGTLVGVNTAIYGKAQGIGFAIPIDKAKRIVVDLLRHGEVRRPFYGVDLQDLNKDLAQTFDAAGARGALISSVDPKGPAAGDLKPGDIIVEVGGIVVQDSEEARLQLGDYTVGASVTVEVLRGGTRREVILRPTSMTGATALERLQARIGIQVMALSGQDARRIGMPDGIIAVRAVASDSAADRVGFRQGLLIRAVDSEKVIGMDAFGKALARSHWRGQVSFIVQSGRAWQEVIFEF